MGNGSDKVGLMREDSIFADLVIINGKILTMDEEETITEAVAVKFAKILATGTNEEIKNAYNLEYPEEANVTKGAVNTQCNFIVTRCKKIDRDILVCEKRGNKNVWTVAPEVKRLFSKG